MKYPKIPLAQTLIQLCKAKQIEHIVISPGSRNAPLTIGFTHDKYFTCYSIVDERCAAFFAMGMAQQIQKPVAVVCTSGSALLNYYPAIAEAFYSDIPLVVLSADRPDHLIGIGDGQTINQKNVFKNHIVYSANLKLDATEGQEEIQSYNEKEINKALNLSDSQKGPVHINIPLNEPLYDFVDNLSVNPKNITVESISPSIENLKDFVSTWNTAKKKLVLVGVNPPNAVEQQFLDALAQDDSVIVFTETTSNIKHQEFFSSIDKMIAPLNDDDFNNLKPDVLLTFGGLIVSKKIKAFLRTFKPKQHWHIDKKKANNTFFSLSHHFKTTPNQFFKTFLPDVINNHSDYKNDWSTVKASRSEKHNKYLKTISFSDFKVFDVLLKSIPDNSILQLSNSSTIRYAQLFDLNNSLKVFCNRGTSGIDGSTSTAIGSAVANKNQSVFITGDLSFFYDSNALWNNYIPKNFRIIIINNQGGGIFRILPGHKNTQNFDTYFETKHSLTAKHLCAMYGFKYEQASSENELNTVLTNFYKDDNLPKILEIFTPSSLNDTVLMDYFKALQ